MARNVSRGKEIVYLTLDDLFRLLAQEKNGRPNYGAILRYHRLQAGWTAEKLALLYSEALGLEDEEAVTPSRIYMMENKNDVPLDEKRRWILTRLLDIPPALFGLEPLKGAISGLFQWEEVDVQEYRRTLDNYNQGWHSGSVFKAVSDIKRRMSNLHNKAPYSTEKKEMLELLCGYQILLADLAHDYMDFDAAIEHLNRAIIIAEQEHFYDVWAFALRQRGGVYKERGEITAGLKGYTSAKQDFSEAVLNYQQAQSLESKIQPLLKGIIDNGFGVAYAYIAQSEHEFKEALHTMDAAVKVMGKGTGGLTISTIAMLDEERYHLNRAATYLAYSFPKTSYSRTAQRELEYASTKATKSLARKEFGASLLAKSYLVAGEYRMASAYAEDALNVIQERASTISLARLNVIYQNLKNSPYGKSTDVALLGTKLLKIQKPELFH